MTTYELKAPSGELTSCEFTSRAQAERELTCIREIHGIDTDYYEIIEVPDDEE